MLLSFPVQAKVKSKDIKFPGKFYTDEIKTCAAMPNVNFKLDFYKKKVEGLIGYDWPADHKANSNSLNVEQILLNQLRSFYQPHIMQLAKVIKKVLIKLKNY